MPPLPVQAHCITCGYQLNGVVGSKCPECGRAFDPRDPDTWIARTTLGRFSRWLKRPPGLADLALTAAASLVTLYAYAPPGCFSSLLPAAFLLWAATATLLSIRIGIRLSTHEELLPQPAQRFWIAAAIIPAVVAITFLLNRAEIPLRICFWLGGGQSGYAYSDAASATNGSILRGAHYEVQAGPFHLTKEQAFPDGTASFSVRGDRSRSRLVYIPISASPSTRGQFLGDWLQISPNWFRLKAPER